MPDIHLLLDEAEVSAMIELGAHLEPFLAHGSPLETATTKMDEQMAQQTGMQRGWKADDMVDLIWDAVEALRNVGPDDPAVRDWAVKAVDHVLGVNRAAASDDHGTPAERQKREPGR
jgi:hypothetical protein